MHGLLGHWEKEGQYAERHLFWTAIDREVGHLLEVLGYKDEGVEDANEEIDELLGNCYDCGVYFRVHQDRHLKRSFLTNNF